MFCAVLQCKKWILLGSWDVVLLKLCQYPVQNFHCEFELFSQSHSVLWDIVNWLIKALVLLQCFLWMMNQGFVPPGRSWHINNCCDQTSVTLAFYDRKRKPFRPLYPAAVPSNWSHSLNPDGCLKDPWKRSQRPALERRGDVSSLPNVCAEACLWLTLVNPYEAQQYNHLLTCLMPYPVILIDACLLKKSLF